MNTQTIEIDCPDGMKPVYDQKNNKITFVPVDPKEKIQTVEDAADALGIDLDDPCDAVPALNLEKFIELQAVLKAVNGDHKWSLTEGTIWYPWVRFIREDRVKNEKWSNEEVIAHFKYKGTRFALVGGHAAFGGSAGLGFFYSSYGVGDASAYFSFLSCKDEETARYVSKKFGKLVFEAVTAFKLEDIEWLD